ncbi:MAG: DUF2232 domain-containing protein [Acidaminococcaceae bacterium]
MFFATFDKAIVDSVAYYQSQGMTPAQIEDATKSAKDMLRMVQVIMPGAFILCAPIITFVNYLAARAILSKLGEYFESFPRFVNLEVPKWVLLPYGASLLVITQYISQPTHILYLVGVNIQMLCSFVLVIQGIALVYWYMEQKHKPKWWGTVVVGIIFLNQFVSQVIVLVGAFDLVFDFRKVRTRPPE